MNKICQKRKPLFLGGKVNSPFNEAHYNALLKGLEIAVLNLSEVLNENKKFRFDSEYFQKEYLLNEKYLQSKFLLKDFCLNKVKNIKTAILSSNFQYLEISGVILNSLSYQTTEIDYRNIPDRATYILENNDIVISTVRPNRNGIALIKKTNDNLLVGTSGFTILRTQGISPEFVFAFCKTKFFITKLMRENTATMYPAVLDSDIYNVSIPILSPHFQNQIESAVKTAHNCLENSAVQYQQAEKLLLQHLDIEGWQPANQNVSIKTFANSFGTSGRLDAEYYQPKYEELEAKIKQKGAKKLGELVLFQKSIETGSDAYNEIGIPYVRVSDINKQGISQPNVCISEAYYHANKKTLDNLFLKKDTVLLSKDGTVGIAYKISDDLKMITSGALLHLFIKDYKTILPDYLTLVLNSIIVQTQAKRDSGGSIIVHWRISEIENILIPILPLPLQEQIANLVQASFNLRGESTRLLAAAKTGVEIAIEQGEEAGALYLAKEGQISKVMLLNQPFVYGAWAGQIKMSADFDEPLADFNEYM